MILSRRTFLASSGAALTTLAGCSALDAGDDAPTYDTDALTAVAETDLPQPPTAFPVAIPPTLASTHRTRARTLLDRVPETPALPNDAVARRLRDDRADVVEDLAAATPGQARNAGDALDRLGDARTARARAAAVAAAYRAATDDIAASDVAARRERLRGDLRAFERDWQHRGRDAATALVVHRELESLRRAARRGATPDHAFPLAPTAAVFDVGEIVRRLEDGQAALADAARLRARYLEGSATQRSYATALAVGTARLRRWARQRSARLREYVDPDTDRLPFERSIDGTALERVYRRAAAAVQRRDDEGRTARQRGAHATALLEAATGLVARRTLGAVIKAIRAEDLVPPTRAADVRSAQQRAIDRVTTAWRCDPAVAAVALTRPAQHLLHRGTAYLAPDRFDDTPPDAGDAERAFASYVHAAYYAAVVPDVMATIQDAYLSAPPAA